MTSVAFQVDQLLARVPGGIGTYVGELVPALMAADPEVAITLFHARAEGRSLPEGWAADLPVVPLRRGIRTLYPGWALAGLPALPEPLRGQDVLHSPSPAAVPPAGPGQRLVVTVHDLAFLVEPRLFPPAWRTMYRMGLRRAVRHADALVAVSEHTARDLVDRAGADAGKIHVTPLAATLPASAGDPGPAVDRLRIPRPYLLFVGTLEPRKNLVRLVRAYRRAVARSELPHALVLAGPPGWGGDALERELAIPAAGEVVRTGRVEPDELDALYRGADAFAYPSLYEGFGLPVVDAMARGIPMIVSSSSSLPEVAGDAALTASPHSVEELAQAIERVLTDRTLAARLTEAGRARATEFSWARTARATLEVYRG
ncbi:MAG: glycosyltransferase family 4 protein [Actinomycetota bacterium]